MAGGSLINTGSNPQLLWPGINAWFGLRYLQFPREYAFLFEIRMSDRSFEEQVNLNTFGLVSRKSEGAPIKYDSQSQNFTVRFTPQVYASGYIMTQETMWYNQYPNVLRDLAGSFAGSFNITKEINAADVLNNAFNNSFPQGDGTQNGGGDGQPLLSNNHKLGKGGFLSNILSTPADLSEKSLEDAVIQLTTFTDNAGKLIVVKPKTLFVHPNNSFTAERILKSQLQNDTSLNATNALRSMGTFPGGVQVNHYFEDADAWFIKTDCSLGLLMFQVRGIELSNDTDFETGSVKVKGQEVYSLGWSDFRTIIGSPGV